MVYFSICQKLLNESHSCVCYWAETTMLSDEFQCMNEFPLSFFNNYLDTGLLSGLQELYLGTSILSIQATNVGAKCNA